MVDVKFSRSTIFADCQSQIFREYKCGSLTHLCKLKFKFLGGQSTKNHSS